jgi:uncharacterized protein YndB with AHSA1/START domain
MKLFLKITIGILLLLALIFFGTGIFIKETTYKVKTTIDKPIDEVFALFNDPTQIKNWLNAIKSFEPINETKNKIGSTYKITIDNKGQDFVMTEKITAFDINKEIGIEFDAQGMLKNDFIEFSSDGNKTVITNNVSCKGTNFMLKCTFPYFKKAFMREDQNNLDNFKNYIETKK